MVVADGIRAMRIVRQRASDWGTESIAWVSSAFGRRLCGARGSNPVRRGQSSELRGGHLHGLEGGGPASRVPPVCEGRSRIRPE
jgi:hypothetical protein